MAAMIELVCAAHLELSKHDPVVTAVGGAPGRSAQAEPRMGTIGDASNPSRSARCVPGRASCSRGCSTREP